MQRTPDLALSSKVARQMLLHARAAQPREAVGLLGGSATGQVKIALPLTNIASDARAFFVDPYSQFCAFRELETKDLRLLAIYHSHPDGGIDPSPADLTYARHWSCAHLIIAMSAQAKSRMGAFQFDDEGNFERIEIRISFA